MNILLLILMVVSPVQESKTDEIKALKAKLAAAQKELRELRRHVEKAEAAGYHRTDKTLASALPILKSLPDHLQPRKNKNWDAIETKEVNEFVQRYVGHSIVHKARIKSISHAVNPSHRFNESQPKYKATIEYFVVTIPSRGYTMVQRYGSRSGLYHNRLTYSGDDELVAAAKKFKNKKTLIVEGVIKSISVSRSKNNIYVDLSLEQTETSPNLKAK